MTERKTQLTATMNANGVIAGFNQITTSSRAMAKATEDAGKQAGRGLKGVGDGAQEGATKVDRATRTISNAYQRLIAEERALAAIGRGGDSAGNNAAFRAAVLEERARQIGANTTALQPYRKELEEARKANELLAQGMDKAGISARQTAAAMRLVPAQFTDILVSLQGGQNPLTVLLQQGGQLTDMFGGMGNAARALAGYVASLVGPFTAAAGVALALVAAHEAGASETREFEKSIITTGNAAGVTSGQLQLMARNMADVRGTQMAAAGGLAEMVRAGAAGSQELQRYTQAALDWQRATGTAVGETAEKFADLRKAPLEATLKLNESMGYMTTSTYAQIKALVEQGRQTEAANVAQKAYANTLAERAPQMEQQLGSLERGWKAIKSAIGGAVDAALQIGRAPGLDAQLEAAQQRLATLQERASRGRFGTSEGGAAFGGANTGRDESAAVRAAQAEVEALTQKVDAERRAADEKARGLALGKAQAEWDKEGAKFQDKAAQRDEAIRATRERGQELVRAGLITEAELTDRIASIREKYADRTTVNDGINAQIEALKRQADVEDVITARAQAQLQIRQQLGQISSRDAAVESTRLEVASIDRQIDIEREALVVAARKKDSLREQAEIQGRLDKLTQQRLSAEIQGTSQLLLLEKQRKDQVSTVRVAELEELQAARAAADAEASKRTNAALDAAREYERVVKETVATTELEVSLLGRSERERNTALGQLRVELDLRRRIRAVEDLKLPATEEAERIAELRTAGAVAAANVANQVILEESRKTNEEINRGLTDALMRGFEAGKGFAENLRDTVVNMFQTMVLRPVVSAVVQPAGNLLGGLVSGLVNGGAPGGGAGGGNNLLGLASNASSAYSMYANAGSYLSKIGGWFGMGGGATSTGAAAAAANAELFGAGASQLGGAGAAAGSGMSAIPIIGWILAGIAASNSMYGKGFSVNGYDTGTAIMTGNFESKVNNKVLNAIGLSDKWADILSGGPLVDKALDFLGISGGERRFGAQYGLSLESDQVYNARRGTYVAGSKGQATFLEGPSGGGFADDEVKKLIGTTVEGINGIFKALESDARITDVWAGLETSTNDRGGVFFGGRDNQGRTFGETSFESTSDRSPNAQKAFENLALDAQQATLQALQSANDLPKSIAAYLKTLKPEDMTSDEIKEALTSIGQQAAVIGEFRDALKLLPFENLRALSYDTAEALIAAAGGLDTLNANLSGYFQNFYSEEERRAASIAATSKAFGELGLTMPSLEQSGEAARAQFRALVEGIDVTTEAGQKQYAGVLALQGAYAELTNATDTLADSMKRSAAEIASERDGLQRQLLQLQGNTAALRAMDLEKLDVSNRPLQEQIWALQDAQTAAAAAAQAQAAASAAQSAAAEAQARAAEQVRNAWKSVIESITDAARSIRDEMIGESPNARAYVEAQFATTTAKARAGDQAAAEQLPELSRVLSDLIKESAASAVDQKVQLARLVASLMETNKAIGKKAGVAVPAFAGGGSHGGGWAMVGEQGPELAYLPPARIYPAGQTAQLMDVSAIVEALDSVRTEIGALRADRTRADQAVTRLKDAVEDLRRSGFAVINQPGTKLATA